MQIKEQDYQEAVSFSERRQGFLDRIGLEDKENYVDRVRYLHNSEDIKDITMAKAFKIPEDDVMDIFKLMEVKPPLLTLLGVPRIKQQIRVYPLAFSLEFFLEDERAIRAEMRGVEREERAYLNQLKGAYSRNLNRDFVED